MYKKSSRRLIAACLLGLSAAAQGAVDPLAPSLRESFEQPLRACAGRLAAVLQPPSLLHDFYARLDFAPQWQDPGRRTALQAQLEQLADDGLTPAEYRLAAPAEFADASAQRRACADLQTSHEYLRALHHLARGRLDQAQVEPFWRAPGSASPNPQPSLLSLAWLGLEQPGVAFAAARPALARYQGLRRVYAERLRRPLRQWTPIPQGRLLIPGRRDSRIPLLAARLSHEQALPERLAGDLYDPALAAAVERFQARHGLQVDGLVGPQTLEALNTSDAARLAQLRVNLERWRWLAEDIEPETLLVDIAGGLLSYYRDGQLLWQGRTVVGRPTRRTPQLKSLVSRLTLNPTWTVPPTILREDVLPEIRRDPDYLAQHRMRVLARDGTPLDPQGIDWQRPGAILLRQQAGPDNPLGLLAIRFPNPFSVYLHDTPSQHLFAKSPRAFSSGCVRIEGILELLRAVLPARDCDEIVRRLADGRTQAFRINQRLPIVLAYWTAEIDAEGQLILRNDLYGMDAALLAALQRSVD